MDKTVVNVTRNLVHTINGTDVRKASDLMRSGDITLDIKPWSCGFIVILVLMALLCLVTGYHIRLQTEGRRTMNELPKMMAVENDSNSSSRRLKSPDNVSSERTETPNPQGSSTVDSFDSEDLYQPQITIRLTTLREGSSVPVQREGTDQMIGVRRFETFED